MNDRHALVSRPVRHLPSGRRRRTSTFALALWLAALSACGSDPAPLPVPQLWVLQAHWLFTLDQTDKALADKFLGSDSSVLLGNSPSRHGSYVPTAFVWTSFRRFRTLLADPNAAPSLIPLRLVMYDPEAWNATPINEQRHPVVFMQRFARLARSHGWQVLLTPNPNLMTVPRGDCVARPGESPTAAYVRCNIAGFAAEVADIVETQAQAFESTPKAYSSFVRQTVEQARRANPRVRVISGLTTSQGAAAMYAAWNSVRGVVDGSYLSIRSDPQETGVALEFLRMLPGAPSTSASPSG